MLLGVKFHHIQQDLGGLVHALGGDALAGAVEVEAAGAQIGTGQTLPGEHGAVGADEVPEGGSACLTLGERHSLDGAEVLAGDSNSLGAANTDDADGSTLSGGYGTDGIVGMKVFAVVHEKILLCGLFACMYITKKSSHLYLTALLHEVPGGFEPPYTVLQTVA